MKILSFDISSSTTGFAVVEDDLLKHYGTIVFLKKMSHGEKLVFFEKQIKKLIKQHKPDDIVLEDIFRGPSVSTFKLLAMFRGVAVKEAWSYLKRDPISFMPSEARLKVGVGKTKEEVFEYVVKKYNLNMVFEKDNDITDAILLGCAFFSKVIVVKKSRKRKKSTTLP